MFSTLTLADSIKNLIDKNNTDTSSYDVSSCLETRIEDDGIIVGFHKNKPLANFRYPVVFVEPTSRQEEFESVANSRSRKITVPMSIVSITQFGFGQEDGRSLADRELIQLTDNITYLFRNYTRLSNTSYVMDALSADVQFEIEEYEQTYNCISRITLQVGVKST